MLGQASIISISRILLSISGAYSFLLPTLILCHLNLSVSWRRGLLCMDFQSVARGYVMCMHAERDVFYFSCYGCSSV